MSEKYTDFEKVCRVINFCQNWLHLKKAKAYYYRYLMTNYKGTNVKYNPIKYNRAFFESGYFNALYHRIFYALYVEPDHQYYIETMTDFNRESMS